MKSLKKNLCLVFSLLIALSCSKESRDDHPSVSPWKEYIVYASDRGLMVDSISTGRDSTTLVFSNAAVISIPASSLEIRDYSGSSMPSLKVVGGIWYIGGEDSGIVAQTGESKVLSDIVFAGFDEMVLVVAFRNGEKIEFTIVPPSDKDIPVVRITTDGQKTIRSKTDYIPGSITVEDHSLLYSKESSYSGRMRIRGRGNSTWNRPKKPYRIKLDEKAGLLGFPKDKDWCLLADYYDRSLIRNVVAMELSRRCGFSWTPGMAKVEVWLNDSYLGVYTFCEQKEVSSHKVDIDSTDFYLTIDEVQDQGKHFTTSMNMPVGFKSPEDPDPTQLAYVINYFKSFEAALQGENFKDKEKGYAAWIDIPSFINYYILQELVKNIDGNVRRSTFLTKESGKKMEMYHVWDFDLAIGNCDYFNSEFPGSGNDYTGFYIRDYNQYYTKYTGWYYRLFQDPAFVAAVKERWNELKPQFETIPSYIDRQVIIMGDAAQRNFECWDVLGNEFTCPVKNLKTYSDHVSYLKQFYNQRLEWLDREINEL